MDDNTFRTDTNKKTDLKMSAKTGTILSITIFLTGFLSIGSIYFFVQSLMQQSWLQMGAKMYADHVLLGISVICAFIGLLAIAIKESFFTGILVGTVRIIGILFTLASFMIPRLPGYQSSGFDIFSSGNFVLIDAMYLLPGFMLLLLSSLIHEGFRMKKESEEIL